MPFSEKVDAEKGRKRETRGGNREFCLDRTMLSAAIKSLKISTLK